MAVQIQLRNDSAANWASANPTLAAGEVGVETDTFLIKVGDGSTAWNSLAYVSVDKSQVSYTHTQGATSNTWSIAHNLDFYPTVQIFDSASNLVEGAVSHTDANNLTLTFSAAISGKAYLS
jgi:hypothetical protein